MLFFSFEYGVSSKNVESQTIIFLRGKIVLKDLYAVSHLQDTIGTSHA